MRRHASARVAPTPGEAPGSWELGRLLSARWMQLLLPANTSVCLLVGGQDLQLLARRARRALPRKLAPHPSAHTWTAQAAAQNVSVAMANHLWPAERQSSTSVNATSARKSRELQGRERGGHAPIARTHARRTGAQTHALTPVPDVEAGARSARRRGHLDLWGERGRKGVQRGAAEGLSRLSSLCVL